MNPELHVLPAEELMPRILGLLELGETVPLVISGGSMTPFLVHGRDTVFLTPVNRELKNGDMIFYRRDNGRYVLHRVVKVGKTYTCMGDNQFHKEPGLRHDQMIGIVTEFVRDGKTIPVTDLRYRLYSRLWYHSRFPRRCWRKLKRILSGGTKK
jgi:signal peptidase I